MKIHTIPSELLKANCQIFTIERDGKVIGTGYGFFCGTNYPNTIQFVENVDIQNGDWLINSTTHQRYFAQDAHPIIVNGVIKHWMVKYLTELEYKRTISNSNNPVFNIQSINGNSVIGTQENVTLNIGSNLETIENILKSFPLFEQTQAKELLEELQKIEQTGFQKGSLSKFSDLLKKHENLITAIGGWAVNLLMGQ